jgi:uncharacterized protein YjbI with pentapeptide repeats
MTSEKMQLIRKLRNPDNETVIQAVDELREQGWLHSGTLQGMGLRCANLQGANLHKANLEEADLRMANLHGADLSEADLQGARLNRANLRSTNLRGANLLGADLFNTDLERVLNLTDEQLIQARRLRAATMLSGSRYDGRFNLPGDLRDAGVLHIDGQNAVAMADFYGVSVEAYRQGQEWAQEHLSAIRRGAEVEASDPEAQLMVMLRNRDNKLVLKAVDELRERGWLSSGILKGADLRQAHLQGANLNLASMEGADLSDANLEGADLSVANLQSADLSRSSLRSAKLLWASLQGADLREADLQGAVLTGANLRNTRLDNANLQGVDLGVVHLKKASLFGANLQGAHNLREEELAKAFRLWGATMPDGSLYDGRFNLPGDAEFAGGASGNSAGGNAA